MRPTKESAKKLFWKGIGIAAKGVALLFGSVLVTANLLSDEKRAQLFADLNTEL